MRLYTLTVAAFWTRDRLAKAGIAVQFLALIRTLAEIFRIKHYSPEQFTLATVEDFVGGALIAAALAAVSVSLFFWGRYRSSAVVSALTVVVLLLYKILLM